MNEPNSRENLKQRIKDAFDEVRQQRDVLKSLKTNLLKRARVCVQNNSGHFEQQMKYL